MGEALYIPCVDCGANTAPCTGKRGCRHAGKWEHYMVHNEIWEEAGMSPDDGHLCIGCLEKRIGRRLQPNDFKPDLPCNDPDDPWNTPRLASRMNRDSLDGER